jgi:hypothetical protein
LLRRPAVGRDLAVQRRLLRADAKKLVEIARVSKSETRTKGHCPGAVVLDPVEEEVRAIAVMAEKAVTKLHLGA